MSALVATTFARAGLDVVVANRTPDRAQRLAAAIGGRAVGWRTCVPRWPPPTSSPAARVPSGTSWTWRPSASALLDRPERPLFVADLALPRDVAPDVATLRGVHLADLEALGTDLASTAVADDLRSVRAIVAEEVAATRPRCGRPTWPRRSSRCAPRPGTSWTSRCAGSPAASTSTTPPATEVDRTVHRIVEKLLHTRPCG